MVDQLYTAITATGVGGFVAWLVSSHQRRLDKRDEEERRKALESLEKIRVEQLDNLEKSIADVAGEFKRHLQSDRSGELWTELRSINGNIEKLLSQNQALLISDEAQRQQILTLFNNQNDLKTALKECKQEHK